VERVFAAVAIGMTATALVFATIAVRHRADHGAEATPAAA